MRRQRVLEGDGAGENAAVELGQHDVHREIGGAESAGLSRHAARRVVALTTCSTGTSGPSSGVGSPPLPPAANAVVVTITRGIKPRERLAQECGRLASFKLVTTSGAGARPRAASAAQSASTGAVSAASSIAR